jgi:ribosome-associated toxin RatA of RatAB toxin-antitoxin module
MLATHLHPITLFWFMEISRSALVLFPANDMYRLVEDVASYSSFLSWCTFSEVLEQGEDWQLASMEVAIAGLRQSFTTRNQLVAGQKLTMELVEGPFQSLSGEWRFVPLGERGSKISLHLGFQFSGSLLSSAFRRGFAGVADRLVNDFCMRAESVYGSNQEKG